MQNASGPHWIGFEIREVLLQIRVHLRQPRATLDPHTMSIRALNLTKPLLGLFWAVRVHLTHLPKLWQNVTLQRKKGRIMPRNFFHALADCVFPYTYSAFGDAGGRRVLCPPQGFAH